MKSARATPKVESQAGKHGRKTAEVSRLTDVPAKSYIWDRFRRALARREQKLVHLYTGDDLMSHFKEIELDLVEDYRGGAAELEGVEGGRIRATQGTSGQQFHNAPRRQLVIGLTGRMEVEIGDGSKIVIGPGDLLLADDRSGQGHRTREIAGPRTYLHVYIDESLDLDRLNASYGGPGALP
jgi:hypothetical protein